MKYLFILSSCCQLEMKPLNQQKSAGQEDMLPAMGCATTLLSEQNNRSLYINIVYLKITDASLTPLAELTHAMCVFICEARRKP